MYGVDEDTAATERAKLFDLIEDLVLWENSNNPDVINPFSDMLNRGELILDLNPNREC